MIARFSTSFPASMQQNNREKGDVLVGARVARRSASSTFPPPIRAEEAGSRLGRPRLGFRGDQWASPDSSRPRPVPARRDLRHTPRGAAALGPGMGLGVREVVGEECVLPAQRIWFPPCARTHVLVERRADGEFRQTWRIELCRLEGVARPGGLQ